MKAPMHAAMPCVTINSRQVTLDCKGGCREVKRDKWMVLVCFFAPTL